MSKAFLGGLLGAAGSAGMTAMVVAASATAQSDPATDTVRRLDPIVVTAGRREQPIGDVQASVEVIDRAEIETYSGASVTEEELIEFVRGAIARFKAPRRVIFGELPRTSTGKIQKFVLRERLRN